MAAHQGQPLTECHKLDRERSDVWFFDDNASAGLENPPELLHGGALVAYVVKRINHQDAVEEVRWERQLLGVGANRAYAYFLACFPHHLYGFIRYHYLAGPIPQELRHASSSTPGIQD